MTRTRVRTALALAGLALLALQAWRSDGYYFPDEYFQTVELASYKLGLTPASDLPWEFGERMRPFLQPAAYWSVARALQALGAFEPGSALLAFRLAGALLGWVSLLLLWRALAPRLPDERGRTALLAACLFTWYLPFVLVRTSAESVSGSLLALGLAGYLLLERRPAVAGLAAGLALGLSLDVRYQMAFAVVGFLGWLALVRRARAATLAAFAGGLAMAVALGLLLDRWGYGAWTPTPWNYFRVNLIEGRAARFSSDPVTYYLTSLAAVHAPLSALLLAAMVLFWVKAPRDPITWLALPFFLGHMLLARKSVRFMLPLGAVAAAVVPLLLLDPAIPLGRVRAALGRPWGRKLVAGLAALDLAFAAALVLVPVRHHLGVQRRIREIARNGEAPRAIVVGADPFVDGESPLTFLRPAGWRPVRLGSWGEVQAHLDAGGDGDLFVAPLSDLPPEPWRSLRGLRLVAAPLPERLARLLAVPLRRTSLLALWASDPRPAAQMGTR